MIEVLKNYGYSSLLSQAAYHPTITDASGIGFPNRVDRVLESCRRGAGWL